jgi:hypothetical protein
MRTPSRLDAGGLYYSACLDPLLFAQCDADALAIISSLLCTHDSKEQIISTAYKNDK